MISRDEIIESCLDLCPGRDALMVLEQELLEAFPPLALGADPRPLDQLAASLQGEGDFAIERLGKFVEIRRRT